MYLGSRKRGDKGREADEEQETGKIAMDEGLETTDLKGKSRLSRRYF